MQNTSLIKLNSSPVSSAFSSFFSYSIKIKMIHVKEKFEHLRIPLQAITLATGNFAEKNCIGRGGFGKVYKAELIISGARMIVASKRLDTRFGQGNSEFWKEIVTLSLYKHQNIVSLLGYCDENGEKILVYEYASRGSLDLYLSKSDLTWIQRLEICIGAAHGLAYLHNPGNTQQRVLHRDIKSSNILLDENWNARIADLGLSKFGPANQVYSFLVSNPAGTFGYLDPEYMESGLLTKESDVYSFGIVLFEVLCGRLSFGNKNDPKNRHLAGLVHEYYKQNNMGELIYANLKDKINPSSLQEFIVIAYRCIIRDPKQRPRMSEVIRNLNKALQCQVDSLKSKTGDRIVVATSSRSNRVARSSHVNVVIVDHDKLLHLLSLLTNNHGNSITKEACLEISKITAGDKIQIQSVIDAGLIAPLVKLLGTAGFEVKKEAARAISNATSGATNEQIRYLVSQDCIEPFCDLLVSTDPIILSLSLIALENILRVGEAGKNLGPAPSDFNPYADLINWRNLWGLEGHRNDEIQEKVIKIMKTYWPEYEENRVVSDSDYSD